MPISLTPGDGQDLLARYKRALQQRDPDMLLELFSEDAEFRTDPFSTPLVGANAIRAYWNARAAEQAHVDFDAERVWVVERTVLCSWHAAHTLRESGERIRVRGFSTLEIDPEGRIERLRDWASARSVGTDSKFTPDAAPAPGGGEQHG